MLKRLVLLFIGFLSMLRPLVLLLGFLNYRDRQKSFLLGEALGVLNSLDLRGLFTGKVRLGLFTWHRTVIAEPFDCSTERTWNAIMTISDPFPSQVQLKVNVLADSRSRSTLILNVKRVPPFRFICLLSPLAILEDHVPFIDSQNK